MEPSFEKGRKHSVFFLNEAGSIVYETMNASDNNDPILLIKWQETRRASSGLPVRPAVPLGGAANKKAPPAASSASERRGRCWFLKVGGGSQSVFPLKLVLQSTAY